MDKRVFVSRLHYAVDISSRNCYRTSIYLLIQTINGTRIPLVHRPHIWPILLRRTFCNFVSCLKILRKAWGWIRLWFESSLIKLGRVHVRIQLKRRTRKIVRYKLKNVKTPKAFSLFLCLFTSHLLFLFYSPALWGNYHNWNFMGKWFHKEFWWPHTSP